MSDSEENPVIWHNGRLHRAHEFRLSPFDQGLTIGLGAFESLVAIDGEPFAFSRHWDRLVRSCRGLGLNWPHQADVLMAVRAVAAANDHPHGRLRITVTAGAGPLGSGRAATPDSTCLIVSAPRPAWPAASQVHTVAWPRNERSPLAGLKSTSYAGNALALAEARRRGGDEALMLNSAGHVCEGTGSNVFVVLDGEVLTPPLHDGCLAGVTRALVLEVAQALGLPVSERSIPFSRLADASEAFLTSTTRDVQPILSIDHRPLPSAPGPITRRILDAWRASISRGIVDP